MIRGWKEQREKKKAADESQRRYEEGMKEIREERQMVKRNDLWAMAEHIRNMIIDLRSWIYWLGYDKSQLTDEGIDEAYGAIQAEVERFLSQEGVRTVTQRWLNEMKYELDSHKEIFKRLGPLDPKNEVELRKSSDKLIGLENSIRYSFGRDDYDSDNIG